MKRILLNISLIITFVIKSQSFVDITPPSPEASSILKFVDTPVSLYNGTHNTNIPIYEIKVGDVVVPISLNYYSKGVQVAEISSRVGMGWALEHGGMISRQIRGVADDTPGYGYFHNKNSLEDYYIDVQTRLNEFVLEANAVNSHPPFDYYPDKFMINSPFFSGEFYYDKNSQKFITQKFSNIQIEILTNDINLGIISFKVIDERGNEYTFGGNVNGQTINDYEQTLNNYRVFLNTPLEVTSGSTQTQATTWYLNQIKTNTNEIISFKYDTDEVTFYRRTKDGLDISGYDETGLVEIYDLASHFAHIKSYQKVIKEINFDKGKILFNKASNFREDLDSGFALDNIEIFNKYDQIVKTFHFDYENIVSEGGSPNNINYSLSMDTRANNRLFLKALNIKDTLDETIQKYKFEYNSPHLLPNRHSNEVDIFGYYNGSQRGRFLNLYNNGSSNAIVHNSVNHPKVEYGLLNKITYPTGGFSIFEYEPNELKYYNNEGLFIPVVGGSNPVRENITVSFFPIHWNSDQYYFESELKLVSSGIGAHWIPAILSVDLECSSTDTSECNYAVQLVNHTTGEMFSFPHSINMSILLKNNCNYSLRALPKINIDTNNFQNNPFFIAYVSWTQSPHTGEIAGPGNRIKKINNFSSNGNHDYTKFYDYKIGDNHSTGYMLSMSNFRVIDSSVFNGRYFVLSTSSRPSSPFSSFVGDNFGYRLVNEYHLEEQNPSDIHEKSIGKTIHYFSLVKDYGEYWRAPLHPVSSNEWLRGKEMYTEYFKRVNNDYIKVKDVSKEYRLFDEIDLVFPALILLEFESTNPFLPFEYSEIEKACVLENFVGYPYLKTKRKFAYPNSTGMPIPSGMGSPDCTLNGQSIGYRTTFFGGGTFDLKKVIVNDYFDDQILTNTTEYEYDYDSHYNVSSISETTSSGNVIKTKYSYAPDLNNVPMNDKNMVGIPLITETKHNGVVISTQETTFKDWSNDLLAPEFIKSSKGANATEVTAKYNLRDEKGNPLEVQQENGMITCYIWAYNKTLPVAKLENIAYSQIPPTLITAIQTATDDLQQTEAQRLAAINIAINALRSNSDANMKKAMITTYTHKPLVGLTSVTDPKGDTQTYEYDSFNRLEFVKDKDGNILSENQYHYRPQN